MNREEYLAGVKSWCDARQRARTDLLYLCNTIMGYKDVQEVPHGTLIRALQAFPGGKDVCDPKTGQWLHYLPSCGIWDLQGPRRRLFLWPRGHLKTSIITIAHTIQWIINFPDIRILISTAVADQAQSMLKSIKSQFQFTPEFRALFPEFCPSDRQASEFGNQEEFTVPNRVQKHLKEPTVSVTAIGKVIAGYHYEIIKDSDLVDKENIKTEGGRKNTIEHFKYMWPLIERNKGQYGWRDTEGTRYDFCLHGSTPILMADWTNKVIRDIGVGDKVIGWKMVNGQRMLVPSMVIAKGQYDNKPINRYYMKSGVKIICTPEHKWWKGPWWNHGQGTQEYAPMGMQRNRVRTLRRLTPLYNAQNTRAAGWLAGFFDGEGTIRKNTHHPSGVVIINQTMHNPELIEKTRAALDEMEFQHSEQWVQPSKTKGHEHYADSCRFMINGGWKERYRFLAQIAPSRRDKLAATLFGKLMTEEDELDHVEDAGTGTVYWFQCETGNYIAEGYCSKNSDTYGTEIIEKEEKLPASKRTWHQEIRACYGEKGEVLWPSRWTKALLEDEENSMGPMLFAAQYLNQPVPDAGGLAGPKDIVFFPRKALSGIPLRLHCTIDLHGGEDNATNDYTVLNVSGFDNDGRMYLVDLRVGHFTPFETIEHIFEIHKKHKGIDFKIEKDAHARILLPFLKREMQKRGTWPLMVPIKRDSRISKKQRIMGLQAWFRAGNIRILEDISSRLEIIQQITRFSLTSHYHDDILDTMADHLQNSDGGVISDVNPHSRQPVQFTDFIDKFMGFGEDGNQIWYMDKPQTSSSSKWPGTGL